MPRTRLARFLILTLAATTLTGCDFFRQAGSAVTEQVSRDTWHPDKATNDKVAIHIYLDRSGASIPNREAMGQELATLLDTYPESVTATVYWYSDKTSKIKTFFSSQQEAELVVDQYTKDKIESAGDKSYLSRAVDDLTQQCDRSPDQTNIGVFVTEGGFDEDPTVVKDSVIQLAKRQNSNSLIFVGLNANGTDRLTRLDTFVKDPYMKGTNKHYYSVALKQNDAMLNSARNQILSTIKASKPGGQA